MTASRFPEYTTASAATLTKALEQRILIIDGAMGTMIQERALTEADYRGERFSEHASDLKGNNDLLSLTCPEIISDIHETYLAAGADLIETNTFNATATAQADYQLETIIWDLNLAGAQLARAAADKFTQQTPEKPRFVAGVLGPTPRTASISPDVNDPGARNITFDELKDDYRLATEALIEGGVDLIMIETVFDTLNAKAAIFGSREAMDKLGVELPLMVSATFPDTSGRLLSGQTGEAFWHAIAHARPLIVGSNCGRPEAPTSSLSHTSIFLTGNLSTGSSRNQGCADRCPKMHVHASCRRGDKGEGRRRVCVNINKRRSRPGRS